MKQLRETTSRRVDPGQIGTFVQIAPMTGQSEIFDSIRATVLLRNDVFNVMGKLAVLLMKPAILTTAACTLPHKPPCAGIHCY